MLFKTFVQKLYKAIGSEGTQAEFVFDVLSSILSDKYIEKDQILAKPYSNGGRMFRYYFDGTKSIHNLARKIIGYVDADNFEMLYSNKFNEQPELIRNLVDEFSSDIPDIDDDNYASKLGRLLVQILFETAKEGIDIKDDDYNKLRHSLFEEADGICPITGYRLKIFGDDAFKVIKIDKDLPYNIDNTIAISPKASPTYFYKNSNRHYEELMAKKEELFEKQRIKMLIDDSFYSKKLKRIIDKIQENPTVLNVDLKLKPTEIKNKIDCSEPIFSKIFPLITDYYLYLRGLFKERDGNDFNFDLLCKTIRSDYLTLAEEDFSKMKIFDLLSENLSRKLDEDLLYCEIVISFFVQNCEVFDEISK